MAQRAALGRRPGRRDRGRAARASRVTHPANWGAYKLDLLRPGAAPRGRRRRPPCVTEPEAAATSYAAQRRRAGHGRRGVRPGRRHVRRRRAAQPRTGSSSLGPARGHRAPGRRRLRRTPCSATCVGALGARSTRSTPTTRPRQPASPGCARDVRRGQGGAVGGHHVVDPGAAARASRPRCASPGAEFEAMIAPGARARPSGPAPGRGLGRRRARGRRRRCCSSAARRASRWSAQLVGAELGRPVAVDARPKDAICSGAARVAMAAASNLAHPTLRAPVVAARPTGRCATGSPARGAGRPGGSPPAAPVPGGDTAARTRRIVAAALAAVIVAAAIGIVALTRERRRRRHHRDDDHHRRRGRGSHDDRGVDLDNDVGVGVGLR